jgi:hypothetical protein
MTTGSGMHISVQNQNKVMAMSLEGVMVGKFVVFILGFVRITTAHHLPFSFRFKNVLMVIFILHISPTLPLGSRH